MRTSRFFPPFPCGVTTPLRALAFIVLAACTTVAQAQFTFVSNLANVPSGGEFVHETQWFAGSFSTGPVADGYLLDHVDIAFAGAATDPTFAVSLWSEESGAPNANLGSFAYDSGTRFDSTGGLTVAPSSTYWLVLASHEMFDIALSYAWLNTADPSVALSDGWSMAGTFAHSHDLGASWSSLPNDYLFAVTATAVPEPLTYAAIFGALALVGALVRCRRMPVSVDSNGKK